MSPSPSAADGSPDRREPAGRRHRSAGPRKLLLIGCGALLPLALLLLVEGGLALLGLGEPPPGDDPFVGFAGSRPLFVRTVDAEGIARFETSPAKLAFFNAQSFPAVKHPETLRIFCLGGSTTFGRPYDDRASFCNWLRLFLDLAEADRRHEVVNAGGVSYASYRIVRLMDELRAFEPDAFVLYTGHNEFLEERTYGDLRRRSESLGRVRGWLSGSRIATLARRAVAPADEAETPETLLPEEVRTKLDGWTGLDLYEEDPELRAGVLEHFRLNLERAAEIAERAGAALFLVRPDSNIRDFSPFKSELDPELPPAEAERAEELLARGRRALAAGRPDEALAVLREASAIAPRHGEIRFRLGRALLATGRTADAGAELIRAKELDIAPLRALEAIGEALTAMSRERGLPLVDLPALLRDAARESPSGADAAGSEGWVPGDDFFLDHVHPSPAVHRRIAVALVEDLAEAGLIRLGDGWTTAARDAVEERLLASFDRSYYAEKELNLAKVLGWAGKLEEAEPPLRRAVAELPDSAEAQLNLGILLAKTGRSDEAVPFLREALRLEPDSPLAHLNLGIALGRLGRAAEAVEAFDRALALAPDSPEALHNRGVLLTELGRREEAVRSLQAALELRPGAPEILASLARARAAAGRWAEAESAFRRALEANPDDPSARAGLGRALIRQNRLEEGIGVLRDAVGELQDAGERAEASYDLGVALAGLGRREEAETAYGEALAADPGHAEALNNLGILAAGAGRTEEARRRLEAAVAARPDYADAQFNLGVLLDGVGEAEASLERIRRAVTLSPETPRFRFALGMLLLARGEDRAGREQLETAARLGSREAAAALERLPR